jgi:dTDP-4-amino-4,6-dideoxygalactose transaminase
MIPRNRLDIGWVDLLAGIGYCCWPGRRAPLQRQIAAHWSSPDNTLVCLSVRSGFDLALQALAFPPGSEILVSAVTIPDMVRIIAAHGLIPVPLDLDMQTLSVPPTTIARAITARTRAMLVAHLFGSRMPLEPLVQVARQHGLLLIEDCAQAYDGSAYRGHPQSDITMFSFGPIKTATALGGGLLRVTDRGLLNRMQTLQAAYPRQRRDQFLRRLSKYAGLKVFTYPATFRLLPALCRRAGVDYDRLIGQAVRGFPGSALLRRIRRQPAYPLLALLARRLRQDQRDNIAQRQAAAATIISLTPMIRRPGACAAHHTHWAVPVQVADPDALMQHLRRHGFDASRWASSLHVVAPPADRPEIAPREAQQTIAGLLYLPVYPGVATQDLQRLARAIATFVDCADEVQASV